MARMLPAAPVHISSSMCAPTCLYVYWIGGWLATSTLQVRVLLATGLSMVPDDERDGQEPGVVAAEVEAVIMQKYGNTGAEYAAKVRDAAHVVSFAGVLSLVCC